MKSKDWMIWLKQIRENSVIPILYERTVQSCSFSIFWVYFSSIIQKNIYFLEKDLQFDFRFV